jgi:glycosyltransferase involved in cell wall biosynthesis
LDRQKIFIISQLDFLKAGNQLLFNTCMGFLTKGFDVVFLTSGEEDYLNRADHKAIFGEFADRMHFYRFTPLLRRFRGVAVKPAPIHNKNLVDPQREPDIEETVGFLQSESNFLSIVSWFSFILGGISKALNLLRNHKPVLVVGYEIYGTPLAYIVSKFGKIPLVTRFQGTISYLILKQGKFKAWFMIPQHLWALKTSANITVMENDGTRGKEVLMDLGVKEEKIRFWVDGVKKDMRIADFDRASFLKNHGINDNARILLTLCRLKFWKRVDRAIWLLSQIKDQIPEAILIVVGDGDAQNQLEAMANKLGIGERVIFAGAIPHSEVKQYINACDIFLSLYDHSNLCNPVLEALECGKCIVSIDDGSTKEVLKNNYNAMLVSKNEIRQKLPQIVIDLLENKEAKETLENNALDYAHNHLLSWSDRMNMEVQEIMKLL